MSVGPKLIKSEPDLEVMRSLSLRFDGLFRLQDLPYDILSMLPFPDKDEPRRPDVNTLYSLCLVNKTFNEIFTPRLYSYCADPRATHWLNGSAINRLKNTLEFKPHLGQYVKTLEIGTIWETEFSWSSELESFIPGGIERGDLERARAVTKSILSKTPNLDYLSLSTPSLLLCDIELPNLEAVWLTSCTEFEDPFTSEHAAHLLTLPRLLGIVLTCAHWRSDAGFLDSIESKSSEVALLDVEDVGPTPEFWPHLLRIPKALEGLMWRNSLCYHDSPDTPCDHCTVDEIQEGLNRVAPDLEELELEWTPGPNCRLLEMTSLDCRHFPVLEILKISCRFLIGPAGCIHSTLPHTIRQTAPRELANRLPASLEEFYLTVYSETKRSNINEILRGILEQSRRLRYLRTIALILKGGPPSDCLLCAASRSENTIDSLTDFGSLKAIGRKRGMHISADDEQLMSDMSIPQGETA